MDGLYKSRTWYKGLCPTLTFLLDLPQPATTLPLAELPPESSSLCVCFSEGLKGSLPGPQELDSWLVRTVRALQESMRDVQGRLQSLESMPAPPKQVSPPRPRARVGQNSEGLCIGLLIQPLLCPTSLPAHTFASSRECCNSRHKQGIQGI